MLRNLLVWLWLGGALDASAESVQFHFAPLPDSRWSRTSEDRSMSDMGGMAPARETLTRQELSIQFEALPDGSWRVIQTPRSASLEVDGQPMPNPALDLTVGAQIELTLNPDGTARQVRGFRELLRRLEDNLPAAQYAMVTQRMTEASLGAQEMSRWNSQLGRLRGETVQVGESWVVTEYRSFAMGNAEPVEGVLAFTGWAELEGERGLKIEFEYDNRGDAVRRLATAEMRRVDWRPEGEVKSGGNVLIRGKELRVIVPATGQLLYHTTEQVAELQPVEGVDTSGMGIMEGHFEDSSVHRWRRVADTE